jgi:hypothetical protein
MQRCYELAPYTPVLVPGAFWAFALFARFALFAGLI